MASPGTMFMKLFTFSRRILGRRVQNTLRNFLAEVVVRLGNYTVDRPNCISALMRVKNEEWWIRASLLSIKNLVYEYIIIDSSTDKTTKIIDKTVQEYGLRAKHILDYSDDIVKLGNRGLSLTTCRWILRWDGDFVMKEEGVTYLKSLLKRLNPRMNYIIYWPHICLDIDLCHYFKGRLLHKEHWLVTYTPGIRFIKVPKGYEYLYIPPWLAKRIEIDKPLSFHLRTVKPPERLLVSKYWHEWLEKDMPSPFNEYLEKRIIEDFGTKDVLEAAKKYIEKLRENLEQYSEEKYGKLPELILKEAYRVCKNIYKAYGETQQDHMQAPETSIYNPRRTTRYPHKVHGYKGPQRGTLGLHQ